MQYKPRTRVGVTSQIVAQSVGECSISPAPSPGVTAQIVAQSVGEGSRNLGPGWVVGISLL